MSESLEDIIICIRQLSRPLINLSASGHGDCRYCKADKTNNNCTGYYQITLHRMEAQNGENREYKRSRNDDRV